MAKSFRSMAERNHAQAFAWSRQVQQGVELRAEGFAHRGWESRKFLRELVERRAQAGAQARPRKQRAQPLGRAVEAVGEDPFDAVRQRLLGGRALKLAIRLGEGCCTGLFGRVPLHCG